MTRTALAEPVSGRAFAAAQCAGAAPFTATIKTLAGTVTLLLDNGCLHGIPGQHRPGWAQTIHALAAPGACCWYTLRPRPDADQVRILPPAQGCGLPDEEEAAPGVGEEVLVAFGGPAALAD